MSLNPSRDLREFVAAVHQQLAEVLKRLVHMEKELHKMPTRQEMDQLKSDLKQAIQDEAAQVAADIQALKDQLANGQPITQQDLDDLRAAVQGVAGIDPDQPTP